MAVPITLPWDRAPKFPELQRTGIGAGLRRAVVAALRTQNELAENQPITHLSGGSVASPVQIGHAGEGLVFISSLYNGVVEVPGWTDRTGEASVCLQFHRTTADDASPWKLSNTGQTDHFPFSGGAYIDALWSSRWINNVAAPTGFSFGAPTCLVLTVKNGEQRAWWNGRLWVSAANTGGFSVPTTFYFFSRPLNGIGYQSFAWERALSSNEAAALSANPNLVWEPRSIWVPVSAGGGSLDLTQTTGIALAGTVSTSGDIQIGTNFNLTQSSAVGLTGSLATTGDIQIGTNFNLAQTANVGLAGVVGISGDIQILSGSLDLTQTAAVAMSGTVGLSGDIQIGTSFNLAQTAAVGLTGVVGTTGNIQIGTSFNLAQSVALAMTGSVAVSGDIQSGTAPVVTQSFGNFGWDPRKRLSWKRKELREELEAALDEAPKAVKTLVETTTSPQASEPLQKALATVREALRQKRGGSVHVVRQEIDELHEALETVATFTRERAAARQARRRKQQAFLLLS